MTTNDAIMRKYREIIAQDANDSLKRILEYSPLDHPAVIRPLRVPFRFIEPKESECQPN